jgi:hypothetical protein
VSDDASDGIEKPRAWIAVARQSPKDVGQRQMVVSIDGKRVATLLYGQEITVEVDPGPHRLRVHNTLVWKTVELELAPGEHARFSTINRATWGTYAMVSFLGAGPLYVTLERVDAKGHDPSTEQAHSGIC